MFYHHQVKIGKGKLEKYRTRFYKGAFLDLQSLVI